MTALVFTFLACGDTGSAKNTPADGGPADEVCAIDICTPTTSTELNAWLRAGRYSTWPRESAIHASVGPHSQVRVSLHPSLDASLRAGSTHHPKGAVAVKELYRGTTLNGWAVSVKVKDESEQGKGWFWYEVFSVEEGASPVVSSLGASACAVCHSGGRDYVLSKTPLQ